MGHTPRVLANEIRLDLLHSLAAGERTTFGDRLAIPDDARVGVHFEEQPARLDQGHFELGDLQIIFGRHGRIFAHALLGGGFSRVEGGQPYAGESAGDDGSARGD